MAEPTVHSHVARKPHRCFFGGDTIEPGERYLSQSWPPWTLVPDDVDEDGRTIYDQMGEWFTQKYHAACRDKAEFG